VAGIAVRENFACCQNCGGLASGSAEPKTAAQAAAPITPGLSSDPGTRYANVNYRTLGRLVAAAGRTRPI
jgi:hypothetical protein